MEDIIEFNNLKEFIDYKIGDHNKENPIILTRNISFKKTNDCYFFVAH